MPPQVPRDLLKHLVSEFCLHGRAPSAHWVAVRAELFLCTLHSMGSSLHPHPQPTTHVIPADPHGISAAVLCTTPFRRSCCPGPPPVKRLSLNDRGFWEKLSTHAALAPAGCCAGCSLCWDQSDTGLCPEPSSPDAWLHTLAVEGCVWNLWPRRSQFRSRVLWKWSSSGPSIIIVRRSPK